jgi:tetratricopeptide (TPR) repeat protein
MTTKKNTTTAAAVASMEPPSTRLRRLPYVRPVQNFLLVWLDRSIDEETDDDCRHTIIKLRQVVNQINTFTDVDECIDFISDIEDDKIFIIVSGEYSEITVPVLQDILPVSCIYIFSKNKPQHEQWTLQWSKVKGVFTDITSICEVLKQAAKDCDQNMVSISFIKPSDKATTQNLNELDQSFMYTQILKEILITIDFEQEHFQEFLIYCREQFAGNTAESKHVDKLENEYSHHQPIWWYTCGSFLYSMLNRALRMMEIDLIIKMGFFIRDLHDQITTLHFEQNGEYNPTNSFSVYRGQGLTETDFDQLLKTKDGLMSFNNFLSTSLDEAVSFAFAESNQSDPALIAVFFKITVAPSIPSTPFANLRNASYYQQEEEILFSMHSVFRIGVINQIDGNNRFWQVGLTLTGDTDPQLHAVTKCLSDETRGSTGWHRLGNLMMKLGNFNKAEELCQVLLTQTTNESKKQYVYQMLVLVKEGQGDYEKAIEFYQKSIKVIQKLLPPNHPDLASFYNNIGGVYFKMGEYSKALSYYENALEIRQKIHPRNHLDLATSYNSIGLLYDSMGEYSKALSYYEKDLEIRQKSLPPNHPGLAISYNNIGLVYYNTGEYSKALSCYKKALEIRQKSLPPNHPDLANSYNNIGSVYHSMSEYSKVLSYYEKTLEIRQKSLPSNHPDLANSYNNIGSVYFKMGEYSKALSYYEKTLEIRQKSLPPNYPSLAVSYNNIGLVYDSMGEYSKVLSYYEKALEIRQKNLLPNHPDLAISYNNIGGVYYNMGEYSKALSYYEKALEIRQKSLPPNHPDLAISYNNIGLVYNSMGEYSKVLSYYEKALEIRQKNLLPNHPDLAISYNNIGGVYYNMGEYSKALSCFERAVYIGERSLPASHPTLEKLKTNLLIIKKNYK